jgi:glycosyltransferase involved in cell wall biosynthesis
MKKRKILFVIYSSALWGDNRALLNILDGIVLNGFLPLVIVSKKGDICVELESRGINYKILPHYFCVYPPTDSVYNILMFFFRLFRILWFNFFALKKLVKIAQSYKPDIIHTNVGPVHIGFKAAKKLGIPHVWHIREYQELDLKKSPFPTKNYFIKSLHNPVNFPIAITKGIFEYFSMNAQARIIHDGVIVRDEIKFTESKEKYFLFVGRLAEGKGVHNLISAFIEFCKENEDVFLKIAGTGDSRYEKRLSTLVQNAGLTNRVHFLGFRRDIYDLMNRATALIVPSHFEGFGFITVEAMYNGCLVIGNRTGGTEEILGNSSCGILYLGQEALVNAMRQVVINGIDSYYPMLKKAQEESIELYSQKQNTRNVILHYEESLTNFYEISKNDRKYKS